MGIKKYNSKPLPSLFCLYASLNYNGYDKENNKKGMHPFRKKVRNYLQNKSLPKFDFCHHPYHYTKQILTTKNFKPTPKTEPIFIPAINYLQEFTQKAHLISLENQFIKETQKTIKPYRAILPYILQITGKFFKFQPNINKLIFTVNLLESYYRGFSIQIDKTGYLITGPSETPNSRNVLHELIHLYLNNINLSKTFFLPRNITTKISQKIINNYGDNLLSESFVRALVVYLSQNQKGNIIPKQKFNSEDILMVFPEKIFKLLDKKAITSLTKVQIKELFAEIINQNQ